MRRDLPGQAASAAVEPILAPSARQEQSGLDAWSRWAVIGIFLIMAGAVLALTRDIVIRVISAMILGGMVGPLAEKLQARGIPFPATALLLVLALVAAIYGLVLIVSVPVTECPTQLSRQARTAWRESFCQPSAPTLADEGAKVSDDGRAIGQGA